MLAPNRDVHGGGEVGEDAGDLHVGWRGRGLKRAPPRLRSAARRQNIHSPRSGGHCFKNGPRRVSFSRRPGRMGSGDRANSSFGRSGTLLALGVGCFLHSCFDPRRAAPLRAAWVPRWQTTARDRHRRADPGPKSAQYQLVRGESARVGSVSTRVRYPLGAEERRDGPSRTGCGSRLRPVLGYFRARMPVKACCRRGQAFPPPCGRRARRPLSPPAR